MLFQGIISANGTGLAVGSYQDQTPDQPKEAK